MKNTLSTIFLQYVLPNFEQYRCWQDIYIAVQYGLVGILDTYWSLATKLGQITILKNQLFPVLYRRSAYWGQLSILTWLETHCSLTELHKMNATKNYAAFKGATRSGQLTVLNWLRARINERQFTNMLKADDYACFRNAAEKNHLDILHWLWDSAPTPIQGKFIAARRYQTLRWGIVNGNLKITQWLWQHTSADQKRKFLSTEISSTFTKVLVANHFGTVKFLWGKLTDQQQQKLLLDHYGHAEFNSKQLLWLYHQANDNQLNHAWHNHMILKNVISNDKFFRFFLNHTSSQLQQKLIQTCLHNDKNHMLAAEDYTHLFLKWWWHAAT